MEQPPTSLGPVEIRLIRDRPTWMAYLILGLFAYLETSVGPAMPFVRDHLDLGYAAASLHFSAFAIGMIVAGAVGERVTGPLGRRRTLWLGIAGMVLGVTLLAVGPHPAVTITGTFIMGVIGSLCLVANQAFLADHHQEARTVALTESNVAASSGAILAPLAIGGFDAAGIGWQAGLLIAIPALALLYAIFRTVRLPDARHTRRQSAETGPLPRAFWVLAAVLALAVSVEWCVAYWGADFLASVVGLRDASAATAMSVFFGAMVLGRLVGSRLARRRNVASLLVAAMAVAAVGFPLFWLAPVTPLNLAGLFIAGFGIANFYPLTIGSATGVAGAQADRAAARLALIGGASFLVAPLVVGAVSDVAGLRWGFGIVLPLLAGGLGMALVARRADAAPGESLTAGASPR